MAESASARVAHKTKGRLHTTENVCRLTALSTKQDGTVFFPTTLIDHGRP
jgi:hypothetical protein